jgi:hypothetical protein
MQLTKAAHSRQTDAERFCGGERFCHQPMLALISTTARKLNQV